MGWRLTLTQFTLDTMQHDSKHMRLSAALRAKPMRLSAALRMTVIFLGLCLGVSAARAQMITQRTTFFVSTYDLQLLCPRQVEWTLHSSDIGKARREPSWRFMNDLRHPLTVGTTGDYRRTGFDRGHLCPALDRSWSRQAMRSTFVMSNIAPQIPSLNRGAWKVSEDSCRALAGRYDSIRIVVLPVFLQRDTLRIGTHHLAVPHAFMKAAWVAGSDSVLATWFYFNR